MLKRWRTYVPHTEVTPDQVIADSNTPSKDRLVKVSSDMDLQIHDINSPSGKVYKIEMPSKATEYFLLANRQNTYDGTANMGSYYDEYAPTSGLLIYHVDEDVAPRDLDDSLFPSLQNGNVRESQLGLVVFLR